MKTRLNRLAVFPVLLLLLAGCEKEEFTQPASFQLQMSAPEAPVMDGSLRFDEVIMHANKVEIEGKRPAGGDVFFDRDLEPTEYAIHQHPSIRFDLPQGIYNRLTINLSFDPDEETEEKMEEKIDGLLKDLVGDVLPPEEAEELGEIILEYDKAKPAFICTGTYTSGQKEFEVMLIINDPLTLNATAVNSKGNREVVIESDQNNSATLYFDLEKWFSVVPAPLLEKAIKGKAGGKEYVLIHKKVNPGLFHMLYNRIAQYTTLAVNE